MTFRRLARCRILVFVLLLVSSVMSCEARDKRANAIQIHLGFENAVKIYRVNKRPHTFPVTMGDVLVCGNGNRSPKIHRLNDLQGRVRIATGEEALRYVRLETLPLTRYLFADTPGLEIVTREQAFHLPNFGITSDYRAPKYGTGYLGIVSAQAFALGHFSPPSVRRQKNRFVITRWILASEWVDIKTPEVLNDLPLEYRGPSTLVSVSVESTVVEQVRECVGHDGAYSRVILKKSVAPDLPDTHWEIPLFR